MLKIGIVGLPNVGKSTLFKALTKKTVDIANYPFCTIEPNVGVVEVPDERVYTLAEFSRSKKTIAAAVEFVDIAGLVKGAAEGEGLGNKFLTHIREVDAIAEVVRVFDDNDVIHVHGNLDPISDIQVIEYELILKDLETVRNRLESAERELRGQKKGAAEEVETLKRIVTVLEAGKTARDAILEAEEGPLKDITQRIARELQLLSAKPFVYVLNAAESQIADGWQPHEDVVRNFKGAPYVIISAKVESELAELEDQEKREYMAALGLKESGLNQLIRTGYTTLGLMTFFTTGEDETRAWTIPAGSSAPRAGRAIHSDFEEKFIRADVINWQKLLEAGSWAKARETGAVRTEGKEYIVKDGDVIEFKV